MATVGTYLNFPGNTEEAFLFYKSVFRTDFDGEISRFKDVPADPNSKPLSDTEKNLVMHVSLPLLGGHKLMGTDATKEMGFDLTFGNNVYISLHPDSKDEADRLFNELSNGGKVEMAMQDMFWGDYYGSCSDKFGVRWMINYSNKSKGE